MSSPVGAPPRPDLDWLRHRTRRVPSVEQPAASGAAGGSTALADFLAGRATRRGPQPAPVVAPPPATPSPATPSRAMPSRAMPSRAMPSPASPPPAARVDDLDLSGDPLDLSAPAPTSPTPPVATPPVAPTRPTPPADLDLSNGLDLSDDLDLSGPSPQPPRPPADLDLSAPAAPPRPAPTPPSASSDLDLSNDLDLSTPPAPPRPSPPSPTPPNPPPASPSSPSPSPAPSADLDLFPEPAPAPAATPPPRPTPVVRTVSRVAPGGRVILTPREPTVTFDRLQSGIGGLTVTAVCSPAVGDLVLGAVYQLADGTSGVLGAGTGVSTAPPRSRRPVLQGGRDEFERIAVDLRQTRSLRRFVVWATSATEHELAWGGTLRLATQGGSRIEIPLDVGRHAGPLVVASVYVVDGEFVVRAELDPVQGVARDVARAYGFGAITWADARTPVL